MSPEQQIALSLVVMAIIAIAIIRSSLRVGAAGLAAAFLVSAAINYGLAPGISLLSGPGAEDPRLTAAGIEQVAIGIAGFGFAHALVTRYLAQRGDFRPALTKVPAPPQRLVALAGGAGVLAYVAAHVLGIGTHVATVNTAMGALQGFVVLAACLWTVRRAALGRSHPLAVALILCVIIAAIKVLVEGFLSFALIETAIILAVAVYAVRPPFTRTVALALVLGYLGFCVFGAYMSGRAALRQAVWGGAPVAGRLAQVQDIARQVTLLTPDDHQTLDLIAGRLNQSTLIGSAVYYMSANRQPYSSGTEIVASLTAPFPRSLWPDKPTVTGGSATASEYTGILFAPGTSVATGPIFEGYINFGWVGVVLVMAIWGGVLAFLDLLAGHALRRGEYYRFALAFVPALALVDSGQNLALVISAGLSSLVVVWALQFLGAFFVPDARPGQGSGSALSSPGRRRAAARGATRTGHAVPGRSTGFRG